MGLLQDKGITFRIFEVTLWISYLEETLSKNTQNDTFIRPSSVSKQDVYKQISSDGLYRQFIPFSALLALSWSLERP